ncbi:DNA helicase UvrD [Candidatus Pacearchaeota archaeon]|nr:DNA helicase UvrD [Candidatus Pacearchaeota archaeon]
MEEKRIIGDSKNSDEFLDSSKTQKQVFADLHIHSRYSRACSKDITIENLVKYAKIKGLGLLGTGDFTHPLWLREIKEKLKEKDGLYYYNDFPFILTGEVSLIYSQGGKGRRVHLVVLAPNTEIVDKINAYLDTRGRRDYDGRPIFNIPADKFVEEMMKISDKIEIIPAHAWTPWFGIFGSMSGFDSLKEAFQEQLGNIHAIETGMSSSPEMNWMISELNNKSIISFSDSHSFWPWRIGREATIFSSAESYDDIISAIRENKIIGTVETEPAYGKYHWDGHANCNFSSNPEKTKEIGGICPVCGKPLTIGVENRVEKLKNQESYVYPRKKPFYKLLPLHELIALAKASTLASRKTWLTYNLLIEKFGNEFRILLDIGTDDLRKVLPNDELLVNLIIDNRIGKIRVKPGFDGKYGEPMLKEKQMKLE